MCRHFYGEYGLQVRVAGGAPCWSRRPCVQPHEICVTEVAAHPCAAARDKNQPSRPTATHLGARVDSISLGPDVNVGDAPDGSLAGRVPHIDAIACVQAPDLPKRALHAAVVDMTQDHRGAAPCTKPCAAAPYAGPARVG